MLTALAGASQPARADTAWAQATFKQAEGLADAGQYEQALALYQQIIAREPEAKLSFCRAGTMSAAISDFPQAIDYYKTCERLLPDSIEPRGELVKIYQITGDFAARDQERNGLINLHKTTTNKETKATDHYLRDGKAGWVMGPTNEVLRQFIGKASLLGFSSLDYWNQAVNERVLNNELSSTARPSGRWPRSL